MRIDTKALVCFFLIACIPPWIGWSLLRFGVLPSDGPWPALYLTGWGASAAGLVATYMEEGALGVRRLLREAVRFRVPFRWWLFVLFVPHLASGVMALLYVGLSGRALGFHPSGFLRLVAPSMLVTFFSARSAKSSAGADTYCRDSSRDSPSFRPSSSWA